MTSWAMASIQSHAASARALETLTDSARSSGTISANEATLLAELAAESRRGLKSANEELAAIPKEADGMPAVSVAADAGADESVGV